MINFAVQWHKRNRWNDFREVDMPFMEDGSIPDMIINPHCLPSRMTINQIMASIMGKTCCAKNETFGDASPFQESSLEKPQDKIHALCNRIRRMWL